MTSSKTPSKTPMVDEVTFTTQQVASTLPEYRWVHRDFARRLELDRARLVEALKLAMGWLDQYTPHEDIAKMRVALSDLEQPHGSGEGE